MTQKNIHPQIHLKRLKTNYRLVAVLWALLIILFVTWSQQNINSEAMGLARQEAISNFNKDQAFRIWASEHGGVYVLENERTPANPYLSDVPERDVMTRSGRQLTLMNPAYMLRQMMDEYATLYGVKGRITSLKPLNPDNAPDSWEREALLAFEKGELERLQVTDINGKPYLRLIRPMVTTEGCLKCHHHQGYQVGDIRGGVGVSVPLGNYYIIAMQHKISLWLSSGVIWIFGLVAAYFFRKRGEEKVYERMEFEAHIWHRANFDSLTALSNRDLFHDRLDQAIANAKRNNLKLALLYIDLDRFKDVNDAQGHAKGDLLLQQVANRLNGCVRDADTVSRLGGDEFTVILSTIADKDAAAVVAAKILDQLSTPFELDGFIAYISTSIGITLYPDDGTSSGILLQNADAAMFKAKTEGHHTYRYFTSQMNRLAEQRVNMKLALHTAIEQSQFELYYQPVFTVKDGSLDGAEALIRWRSPEDGMVSPDQFIPIAEQTGLIIPIGEWVLQQAAKDLAYLDEVGAELKNLSINISSVQFRMRDFTSNFLRFLEHHPHLRSRLTLEMTESVFIDEQGDPGYHLGQLRKHGVRIAMDDFGTGYSSLSYLKRFPVDKLKIDRSFIQDLIGDPSDAALCETIISMGSHLSLKVIAEGVETEEQWNFLLDHGCDSAQGFLRGKPMPLAELEQFICNLKMNEN